jgi:hypothetical protein
MPVRHGSIPPALAALVALSMTLACGSKHAIRITMPDAARSGEVNPAADVARPGVDSNSGGTDGDFAEADGATLSAGGLDSAVDQGGVLDLPIGSGNQVDGGIDGGGMFQCNFAGTTLGLSCADGQYCASFMGGPIGSVATYSCGTLPATCVTNRTCDCLCPRGSTGYGCPDPAHSYGNCTCIASQGSLTLMCGAP